MADSALIGFTGFVGGTLLRQRVFDYRFRSTNIQDIQGQSYDLVVCAGAPGQKWLANQQPERDKENIARLTAALQGVHAKTFVLLSTVDVFHRPIGIDERTPVDSSQLQPYGLHRYQLEEFVRDRFEHHLIVRLPGLVGPGLRKNVVYDLSNENNVARIDPRGKFQFYPTVNLWSDIQNALAHGLRLIHLTAEPVGVYEIARSVFGTELNVPAEAVSRPVASYDFRSIHAEALGATGLYYQYSKRESLLAIRSYVQSLRLHAEAASE
ncbi:MULTISPECIES: NAD(P)-dependent oxidoreductase [Ralstonia]|jgi:nucleoside-diphosphate-sugar epimerase|uniref:NAD(P)-dependent oxidoreductase n=1 Tax=Ralstonia TaxID=48736 RepID=UPI0015FBCAC1|nr:MULTISPECIES: NAD(P)-dependent oxidoreductase [Ralstonia]MBB0025675.1 NAD(P)-dependent oxidoreductase [Ralstonia pickettii]MBB0036303.1 NAD(P)-dependent oxidoreductase [Ralstonia pickettii]MBB0099003.1 NAD(P)-dependent oxidoreductase [Ralstonia pickettii]MBB0108641.1 NAD(P)-dependent oxidoreductase [Ralstonia pickettii]MBB0129777.1 NAD(P)-dependent oxidoreductase [Ralstonia pickettii]